MSNTPAKYWFKRRRYGYGWLPVTPQGFVVLTVWALAFIAFVLLMLDNRRIDMVWSLWFIAGVVVSVIVLVAAILPHAPTPRWRWGKRPNDNPDEDF